jgi:hypothetical protein
MRKGLTMGLAALVLVLGLAAYGVAQQMPQGTGGMMGPMTGPGMGHGQMGPQAMGPGGMGGEQGGRMMDMMGMMQQQMMQTAPMSPEQQQAMVTQCQQMMAQPFQTPETPKGQ